MARVIKNQEKWHALTIKGDHGGDVVLVAGGRRSYLSCHGKPVSGGYLSISGAVTLRKLARAILKNVPAPRR